MGFGDPKIEFKLRVGRGSSFFFGVGAAFLAIGTDFLGAGGGGVAFLAGAAAFFGAAKMSVSESVGLTSDFLGSTGFATTFVATEGLGAAFFGSGALKISLRLNVGLGTEEAGFSTGTTFFAGAALAATGGEEAFFFDPPKMESRLRVGRGASFLSAFGCGGVTLGGLGCGLGGKGTDLGGGLSSSCFFSHAAAFWRAISPASS